MKLVDWKGKIFNDCKIIEPVNELKRTCMDNWIIECHCGKKFKATPNNLRKPNNTSSCGCNTFKSYLRHEETRNQYYNYINPITKVQIIKPLEEQLNRSFDPWICLCPLHDTPIEFIAKPANILSGNSTSCGCKAIKASTIRLNNISKELRISRGLKEDQYLTKERDRLRENLLLPIRHIVFQIDKKQCVKCSKKGIHVHHIQKVSHTNYNDIESIKLVYILNNLAVLCEDCHDDAHDGYSHYINEDIQKELQTITNNRIIPQDLFDEYNEIVKTKIEPWIDEYLNKRRINEKET
jgi:5-methylcytosine-specific restriction endonuclease McrA